MSLSSFIAYSSQPPEVGSTIEAAATFLRNTHNIQNIHTWAQNDIPGRFLIDPILAQIDEAEVLIGDISKLNFNVTYEIGYAIGRGKRAFLILNKAVPDQRHERDKIGIFDTLGYQTYVNSNNLATSINGITDSSPIVFQHSLNLVSPVYLILPENKTDTEIKLISKIKKAGLDWRTYDPSELGRMNPYDTIENVSSSYGVLAGLLPGTRVDAFAHNIRVAFVAGLSHGMEKDILLLQFGDGDPVPLDVRDFVAPVSSDDQLKDQIHDFAGLITQQLLRSGFKKFERPKKFLANLDLGSPFAENELKSINSYYVETDEYQRVQQGTVQVVAGRKGTGKTALFYVLRNHLKERRNRVVLDLRPEGHQLPKFQDAVLHNLGTGSKQHLITAFWEYLLLLELSQKLLQQDQRARMTNHEVFEKFSNLQSVYDEGGFSVDGDFSERLLALIDRISSDFEQKYGNEKQDVISQGQITELIYSHDVPKLRKALVDYLDIKQDVWVLIDNLDKGWAADGISESDLLLLRGLLSAFSSIERAFRRKNIPFHSVSFLRLDVFDLLVRNTPDHGKLSKVTLDWTDPDLLREMMRRRIIASGDLNHDLSFDEIWLKICCSHVNGEESSQYLIDRCLMRPRTLLELVQFCKSHAVNLGNEIIDSGDIQWGEDVFSSDLLTNLSLEMRDIIPKAEEFLYELIGHRSSISKTALNEKLDRAGITEENRDKVSKLLLWYGILGVVRDSGDIAYIYDVNYDIRRLETLARNRDSALVFSINSALWLSLEIIPQ